MLSFMRIKQLWTGLITQRDVADARCVTKPNHQATTEVEHCRDLRVCPREHWAVVLHTISLISMKLCQFKGSPPKLKKTKWFLFWFFPKGDRPPPPPWFFLIFTEEIASKKVKCTKLSLRWYYSEGLHTYFYILK